MTVRAFLKPSAPNFNTLALKQAGTATHMFFYTEFNSLSVLDRAFFKEHVSSLSIKDGFFEEHGLIFNPGYYQGLGYSVTIEKLVVFNRGSAKIPLYVNHQDIYGTFELLEHAEAFWELLCAGELLPTSPLDRRPTLTEQDYARKASLAVANSASIRELSARLDQAMNHIQSLQQAQQNKVLAPI